MNENLVYSVVWLALLDGVLMFVVLLFWMERRYLVERNGNLEKWHDDEISNVRAANAKISKLCQMVRLMASNQGLPCPIDDDEDDE